MATTRRDFIKQSSQFVAATGLSGILTNETFANTKKPNANEKLVVGLIGAKGMGNHILQQHLKQPGVECGAICDIDDTILNMRVAEVEKIQSKKPKMYKDFRKLLEDKSIDAVIIGTPDHWHCLIMVMACQAGKDVYVEKPMANSIEECNIMVIAARKYNRVVQVGQQQRSGEQWQRIMKLIKEGKIGQLRKINVWANFNYGIGQLKIPDEPIPKGVDFDMWLGPAPQRTFNKSRFHGSWRMFYDYGGGLITDWGVHLMDMALWAKDVLKAPKSVFSTGGLMSYPDHAHETADTQSVVYQLDDYTITWEHTAGTQIGPYNRNYGLSFIGNNATIVANRESWEIFSETEDGKYKVPLMPIQYGKDSHEEHVKNFIDCIKSRKDPNCTVEIARAAAMYTHMGNISLRTNSALFWDEGNRNFKNNPEANKLLVPNYRKPWVLPTI